jgi:hypothetical protein
MAEEIIGRPLEDDEIQVNPKDDYPELDTFI